MIAKELGLSPVEIRRKNLIQEPAKLRIKGAWQPPIGTEGTSPQTVRLGEALDTALRESRYYQPKAPRVGRGIAMDVSGEIGGDAHAAVTVRPDGLVTVSMPTYGPGIDAYTTQVVAEELGVPFDQIKATPWSSVNGPTDAGIAGDRGARVITLAGTRATHDLKQQLQALAAELLEWEESTVGVSHRSLVNSATRQQVDIAEIVALRGEPITGNGNVDEPWDSEYASFSAHVAEVAVDPETGHVELLRYTAVHETGQIINPTGFYGQIFGGISQGFGHGTMEEIVLEDGRVTTTTLADYKIPSIGDMPRVRTIVLDSTEGHGEYKVRGIGQKSITLPAPAIANAIADACGARISDLPLTAEKVYRALHGRP